MFRLRQDAEDWMDKIASAHPISSKFDLYFLCVLVGIASGRMSNPREDGRNAPEFIRVFIEDYKPSQHLIIGLLIVAELGRLGISMNEKDSVRDCIRQLVKPDSQTGLTDEGVDALNQYASGGYDQIRSKIGISKPYQTEVFLQHIVDLTRDNLDNNKTWQSTVQSN